MYKSNIEKCTCWIADWKPGIGLININVADFQSANRSPEDQRVCIHSSMTKLYLRDTTIY